MKLVPFLVVFAIARAQEERCCPGLGCFTNGPPFGHLPLPQCPVTDGQNNAPNFNLFTRSNPNNGVQITRQSIPSQFDGSRRTMFITHGWWGNRDDDWLFQIKDAVLNSFDNNVIIIGWGEGSVTIDYPQASSNTRTAGAEAAYISNMLINQAGASADRLWCAGHSLGSHLCGHWGKEAQRFGFTPGRVTGLDPAGPFFDGEDPRTGLWNTDASFVDTIITDRGVLGTASGQRGDANFFPNGGTGDHFRCLDYFRESFSDDCRFNARQRCTNVEQIPASCSECGGVCQVMGEPARENGGSGMFYLTTNSDPPHCQG